MAENDETVTLKPGERAPVSGFYDCDAGGGHRWSTDVKGHPMLTLPEECTGAVWRLAQQRPSS